MALTAAQTAEYKKLLREAKTALHELRTGSRMARCQDQNGEQVTWFKADLQDLKAYVNELEDALGLPRTGAAGGGFITPFFK